MLLYCSNQTMLLFGCLLLPAPLKVMTKPCFSCWSPCAVSTSPKQAALAAGDAALKKRRSRSHLNNKSSMWVWGLCHTKKLQFSWIFSGFSAKLILGCLLVFVHSVLWFSVDKKMVSVFEEHRSLSFAPHPCPYINKVITLKYLAFSRKRSFTRKCSMSCFHHSPPLALGHWEFCWPQ